MRVLSVRKYPNMSSGREFCAHVTLAGRQMTGWGRSESEAIEDAKKKIGGYKFMKK